MDEMNRYMYTYKNDEKWRGKERWWAYFYDASSHCHTSLPRHSHHALTTFRPPVRVFILGLRSLLAPDLFLSPFSSVSHLGPSARTVCSSRRLMTRTCLS